MLPSGFQTPREVTLYYDSIYYKLTGSGEAVPFLYPWAGAGAFAVIAYLLIDHRESPRLRWFRLPLFGALVAFQCWCIANTRAKHPAAAFGVGLLSMWGILWVATIMVINDCQSDFRHIQRRSGMNRADLVFHENGSILGPMDARKGETSALNINSSTKSPQLVWMSYPSVLVQRLFWVANVFCSFRGVGWNWQASAIPPAPKCIEDQLHGRTTKVKANIRGEDCGITVGRTGIRRYAHRRALLKSTISGLVVSYIVLDIVKTLMHNDAYFWGYMDAAAPSYLPHRVQESHFLLKSYRLLISLAGIYSALFTIFKLGPLFFCGILGPETLGIYGEPWMNPADMFGSFDNVFTRGLAGWWAGWWHQVFRFAFESFSDKFLQVLKVNKRSITGRVIGLFTAFFLSGCLHSSGSYTQLGQTRPFMGPMRFFLLQAVGILVQTVLTQGLLSAGILQKVAPRMKQMANLVLVHVWLYYTAPLLMDDFAKGGIWLFEPIAISPLRGLGLGAKDDTWWCWWNGLIFWHQGKHFWDTGLAL